MLERRNASVNNDTVRMNFASLLSEEIAKATPPSSGVGDKYIKRSEVEKQREAAYQSEQQALKAARDEAALKKRKLNEEEAERDRAREEKRARLAQESKQRREEEEARVERVRRKRLGLPDLSSPTESKPTLAGEAASEHDDLTTKLRALGEPMRLFGESDKQRLRRYKRHTSKATAPLTTLELVPEEDMKVSTVPEDADGRRYLYRQLATYFTVVLREWEIALNARSADVKESFQGKAATNAFVQSRENMKPLFQKFQKGDLDILDAVVEIVQAAQERRYVDANDAYLRLSIGKAAWPIGVTMVGIHERSAREKLHESEAHIMSDEVTRKFLQSIKRCISFIQTRWPPHNQCQLMG